MFSSLTRCLWGCVSSPTHSTHAEMPLWPMVLCQIFLVYFTEVGMRGETWVSDSQRDFLLARLWKEQETNSPWRRERKTVFPEGNNRCGGQGRPRMASPGAQVEGGHECLAWRWEELTALGMSVLGFLCMDAACGRAAAELWTF